LFQPYTVWARASQKTTQEKTAILAGGCFWGVEELFRQLKGVLATEVGYTGGVIPHPTYDLVKKGQSGHAEAIQVKFDPSQMTYENLLKFFFKIHDPTTLNQQGNDIGSQYRSAIFYQNEEQRKTALKVKELVEASGLWKKPLVTEIVQAKVFYKAEAYHQKYLKNNPTGYTCHYIRDFKF
jgi:methionine-S-sulfoxide reductase